MKAMKNCVLANELLSHSIYSLIAYIASMKIIFQDLNNNFKLYFQYIGIRRIGHVLRINRSKLQFHFMSAKCRTSNIK